MYSMSHGLVDVTLYHVVWYQVHLCHMGWYHLPLSCMVWYHVALCHDPMSHDVVPDHVT